MATNKRIAEAKDAIINMHINGIATNAISRTLRIAPITIRRVLDEWRATVGSIAASRAKLSQSLSPACETVARAVKTDDKAAFRLLEGMGVLGDLVTAGQQDKAISISINNLLAGNGTPNTHTTISTPSTDGTLSNEPSSRKGPTPQVQLHDGVQNFSEIPQLVDNKGVARIPGYAKNAVQHVADDFDAPMTLGEGDTSDEQSGQFTDESCSDGGDPSKE